MTRSHTLVLACSVVVAALLAPAGLHAFKGQRPGRRAAFRPEAQAVINAFRQVGTRGMSAEGRKTQYQRAAQLMMKTNVTYREIKSILRAETTALVEINKQLAREAGHKVPRHKILKRQITQARRERSEAKWKWLKPGAETLVGQLGSTTGMLVHDRHLKARQPNSRGTLLQWVPGHGGDVWAVKHASGDVAVYSVNEIKPAKPVPLKDYGLWLGR
jgi:hypothetical protein